MNKICAALSLSALVGLTSGCATQQPHVVPLSLRGDASPTLLPAQLTQVSPGMTTTEVQALLGKPAHVESWPESLLWTYDLYQSGEGYSRATVKFDQTTQRVKSWVIPVLQRDTAVQSAQVADQELIRRATTATARSLIAALPLGHFFVDQSHTSGTVRSAYRPTYRSTYTYKVKTTVKHHKDGRTTYKTKVRRKY